MAGEFTDITICITSACLKHSRWINSFKDAGFRVIVGGSLRDANSLLRSLSIFSQYEYVTSPKLGSHLIYAGLSGCKVSLYGSIDDAPLAAYQDHPYYQRHPEIFQLAQSNDAVKHKKKLRNLLSSHPAEATTCQQWAMQEAGIEMMRTPRELAKLLGWSPFNKYKIIKPLYDKILRKAVARYQSIRSIKPTVFK
jgi:hypothetical protein